MVAVAVEYIILGFEFSVIACTLALGIGAYCFGISAIKEIERLFNLINDEACGNENQPKELKASFSECIEAHVIVKQLSIFRALEEFL